MAAKRHERTQARRAALQVLYTSEITDKSPLAVVEGGCRLAEDGPLPDYALELIRGIDERQGVIDEQLAATSENWSLARMPIVDRSVLRLAAYEILYVEDVPTSVAINEAVELAKDFGGEDESHRFVNGVLGRIAKRFEEDPSIVTEPRQAVEDEGAAAEVAPAEAAEVAAAEVADVADAAEVASGEDGASA